MKKLITVLVSIGFFLALYIIGQMLIHIGHYYFNLFFIAFEAAVIGLLINRK